MRPECERYQQEILSGSVAGTHVDSCADCGSLLTTQRCLTPPDALVAQTLNRLRPVLVERASQRIGIYWGLTLAGAFSLPIIIALNAGMIWMSYAAIARIGTDEIALATASLLSVCLLLALSLAYGSLPLLASWGLQLRGRTS